MSDRVPAYSLAGETFVERIERGLALDRVFRRDPEQSIASFSHPGCRNFRRARGTVSGLALAFVTAAFY